MTPQGAVPASPRQGADERKVSNVSEHGFLGIRYVIAAEMTRLDIMQHPVYTLNYVLHAHIHLYEYAWHVKLCCSRN